MFSAFQTFGRLGAGARAVAAAWSPSALWPTGTEPGMWIDPSNLTSQWQDSTGTTPVSTPGSVADSANPVGLALDLRLGALDALGPELVTNGDFSDGSTGWTLETGWSVSDGQASITNASNIFTVYQAGLTPGKTYFISFTITSISGGGFAPYCGDNLRYANFNTVGTHTAIFVCGANGYLGVRAASGGTTGSITNISFKEVPGNHMFQATSTARPLLSEYDGQTLGPGNTYDATGFPIYQKYDGTDDGMATATFAAGTLTSAMDCLIAVRRDAAGNAVCGLYESVAEANKVFGIAESGSGSGCVGSGAGTPTVWVDGAQLTGGTAVTRGTLHTALSAGDWHILELRGLDLSTWTAAGAGPYTSYVLNGGRGGILLFPSSTPTADRDAARTWLGAKVGLTL